MEKEVWKDVPGWEGLYQVSDQGRVQGVRRQGCRGGLKKPWKNKDGYLIVHLSNKGQQEIARVHRLVMLAFQGPSDLYVLHCDDDPSNNRLSNLRYGTQQHNMDDRASRGRQAKGIGHGRTILTEDMVWTIKSLLLKKQMTLADIGQMFGVSRGAVSDIKFGRTWKHVSDSQ